MLGTRLHSVGVTTPGVLVEALGYLLCTVNVVDPGQNLVELLVFDCMEAVDGVKASTSHLQSTYQ